MTDINNVFHGTVNPIIPNWALSNRYAGLNKEQFVSTNASITVGLDISQLLVYGITFRRLWDYSLDPTLLFATILAAFFEVLLVLLGSRK